MNVLLAAILALIYSASYASVEKEECLQGFTMAGRNPVLSDAEVKELFELGETSCKGVTEVQATCMKHFGTAALNPTLKYDDIFNLMNDSKKVCVEIKQIYLGCVAHSAGTAYYAKDAELVRRFMVEDLKVWCTWIIVD